MNLMDDKQLDLDAPLLSVRRFAPESESRQQQQQQQQSPATGGGNPKPYSKRSRPPFYKSDLKSGPVRSPGVVPFVWEQSPGHPKAGAPPDQPSVAPKLPPGRILIDKESANPDAATEEKILVEAKDEREPPSISVERGDEAEAAGEEEEEQFSDALETLSRTESYFMNCSVSGLSGMPGKAEASGSFSTDPQVRDFMMGRFLPAAKAAATGTSHGSSRKPPPVQAREQLRVVKRAENGEQLRVRFPMNYQHGSGLDQEGEGEGTSCSYDDDDEEEEDEDDRYDNGHFSKGCGLIPKFCLLNPVPGARLSNWRLPPTSVRRVREPQIKAMQHGSLGQAEEEYSWEAVYKHKLMHVNPPPQRDASKLTSESNHLTNGSDSLTANGSSPQCRLNTGGVSPYRNEPSQSPFQEGKGFLGVPRRDRKGSKTDGSDSFDKDKDTEGYWVATPPHSSKCESGSMSPVAERNLHAVHMPETSMSKSSSGGTYSDNRGLPSSTDENFEAGVHCRSMDESPVLETWHRDALQAKVTEIAEMGPTQSEETSACGAVGENNAFKLCDRDDSPLCLKDENEVKETSPMPLLPPPLPNSPSESWLNRTLPSVSSKNASAQSFLGMHFQPRKQANSFLGVPKKEVPLNPLKVLRGQTRFADMLAKPLSPQSEI